jgi:hypothetical protein
VVVRVEERVGYSKFMNIPGAADTYIYLSETILVPYVKVFSTNMPKTKEIKLNKDYASYLEFIRSITLLVARTPIDPNKIAIRNAKLTSEIQKSKSNLN